MNVEGFAKRAGKAAPGAMVVLVPKDPDSHRELFRRDQSDQDGSFSLGDVIPGSYTIVAIENGWDLDWSRPGVIANYGKHAKIVTVSDHAQSPMRLARPHRSSTALGSSGALIRGPKAATRSQLFTCFYSGLTHPLTSSTMFASELVFMRMRKSAKQD